VGGTAAALFTYIGYKFAGIFNFGSDLDESFWGAGAAFVVAAVVAVAVTVVTRPKPIEDLHGLVWGMVAPGDDEGRRYADTGRWWQSPKLLGGITIVAGIVLTIIFF
jgi:SSS family solute:Na+ symporter